MSSSPVESPCVAGICVATFILVIGKALELIPAAIPAQSWDSGDKLSPLLLSRAASEIFGIQRNPRGVEGLETA